MGLLTDFLACPPDDIDVVSSLMQQSDDQRRTPSNRAGYTAAALEARERHGYLELKRLGRLQMQMMMGAFGMDAEAKLELVQGDENGEGPWIYRLPATFVTTLARQDRGGLETLGRRWIDAWRAELATFLWVCL